MIEQPKSSFESTASPEEQERLKRAVCDFFRNKLVELEALPARGSPPDHVQRLYELCTSSNRPWTGQKEFDLLGLALPLGIRFDQHSGYVAENRRLDINIAPLLEARDTHALRQATQFILQDVYHETEHIFVPGFPMQYGIDLEGPEQTVEYLCHPGEIHAFARQYAFRYSQAYPGEPFELQKMRELTEVLQNERKRRADAYNYFVAFALPATQEKYRDVVDLAEVHRSIVAETERHLELLRRNI